MIYENVMIEKINAKFYNQENILVLCAKAIIFFPQRVISSII